MTDELRLTPTSHIVLGLLDLCGEATPYELKALAAESVGNFWTLQHAQLYSETSRLAAAGYLDEEREETGRRRKRYRLTARGRKAFRDWVAEPTRALGELRDLGLLKLFFGAEPGPLAAEQLAIHREKLATYERLREDLESVEGIDAPRLTLEAGIGHEREWVRFWSKVAGG